MKLRRKTVDPSLREVYLDRLVAQLSHLPALEADHVGMGLRYAPQLIRLCAPACRVANHYACVGQDFQRVVHRRPTHVEPIAFQQLPQGVGIEVLLKGANGLQHAVALLGVPKTLTIQVFVELALMLYVQLRIHSFQSDERQS